MKYLFVFFAGLFAGWVNVLAGGGSFLTLPALTYSGLGLDVANGTNRLAIFLQNIVAVWRFKKSGIINFKKAISISLPITAGAIAGSSIAVSLPKDLLKKSVGVLLLIVFIFMYKKREELMKKREVKFPSILRIFSYMGVGLYGGFIQAGVGFFLIYTITTFEGTDIVQTNAYKVFSVLFYSIPVIAIFMASGKFAIMGGLLLSAGTMLGAYLSTKLAVKKGTRWVRAIVFIAMISSAVLFILGI